MRRSIIGLAFLAASTGTVLASNWTIALSKPEARQAIMKDLSSAVPPARLVEQLAALGYTRDSLLSEASQRAGFGRSISENSIERMAVVFDFVIEILMARAVDVGIKEEGVKMVRAVDVGIKEEGVKMARGVDVGIKEEGVKMARGVDVGIKEEGVKMVHAVDVGIKEEGVKMVRAVDVGIKEEGVKMARGVDMPLAGGVSGTTSDVRRQSLDGATIAAGAFGGPAASSAVAALRTAASPMPDHPLWGVIRNRRAFDAVMLAMTASSGNPGDVRNAVVREFSPAEEQLKGKPRH